MCSIFGTNVKDIVLLTGLGIAGESRGTDATGVSVLRKGDLITKKSPDKASEFNFGEIPFESDCDFYLGHTRRTTKGKAKQNYNNHPFQSNDNSFVLAHNGVIRNDLNLKREWSLDETDIKTDSYVIVQLLELCKFMYQKEDLTIDIVQEVCEMISGSFTLTIMTKTGKLFLLRHNNPLQIAYNGNDLVYASTKDMLDKAMKFADEKNSTEMLKTFIGEIENDTIYEYNLLENKFVDTATFTAETTKNNYNNYNNNYSYYGRSNYNGYDSYNVYDKKDSDKKKQENNESATNYSYDNDEIDGVKITQDEYYSLNKRTRLDYILCEECGDYYYIGFGAYNGQNGKHLCDDCDTEYRFSKSEEQYEFSRKEEFLTDEEIKQMYPENGEEMSKAIDIESLND
ncbi:MAG: class II glutamine amidotransferase [bacterium]